MSPTAPPKGPPHGPRPDDDAGAEGETTVVTERRTQRKLERPSLYKVILHNDDYTPMEFVVQLLIEIFHHSESDATSMMLHAHTRGQVVAGVYTYEIAEEKVKKVTARAQEAEHPLLCTMEPE